MTSHRLASFSDRQCNSPPVYTVGTAPRGPPAGSRMRADGAIPQPDEVTATGCELDSFDTLVQEQVVRRWAVATGSSGRHHRPVEEPTDRQEVASKGRSRRGRRCDNCNARLRGRFCTRCGQRDLQYDPVVCDNCGAEKTGHYCAVCGQSDRNYRRNVFPVVGEVLSETFEFDSRLLKTIPKLLFRPGFLSAEFSRNRRARYLSPFRLYLFTSIVFFFVLSLSIDLPEGPGPGREAVLSGEGPAPITVGGQEEESPWLRISVSEGGADDDDEEDDEYGLEDPVQPERTEVAVSADIPGEQLDAATSAAADQEAAAPGARSPRGLLLRRLTEKQRNAFERLAPALDEERHRKLVEILRESALADAIAKGIRTLSAEEWANIDTTDRYVVRQLVDIMHRPFDAIRTWLENLPVAMFFLLPLFALLLKCFYPNHPDQKWFYSEHLVFAMHNHTVAFLVFSVLTLLPEGNAAAAASAQVLLLGLPVYYFVAMRRFYGGGRFVTAVKFLLLFQLYGLLLLATLLGAAAAVLLLF